MSLTASSSPFSPQPIPFEAMMPKITTARKEEAIVKACHDYNAEGMTTVVDAVVGAAEPDDLVAYQNTRMRGELTARVYALFGFIRTVKQAKETIQHISTYGDDMFRVGGIKLSLDGGVVPKTGYFYEPYVGEPDNYGRTKFTKEDLMETIRLFHDAGFQTCTHTIGDKAIDWVLDGIENAMKLNPRPDPRHQIIHIYYPTKEAIDSVQEARCHGECPVHLPPLRGRHLRQVPRREGRMRQAPQDLRKERHPSRQQPRLPIRDLFRRALGSGQRLPARHSVARSSALRSGSPYRRLSGRTRSGTRSTSSWRTE